MKTANVVTTESPTASMPLSLNIFLAFAVCLILSNLYGLQPVLADIARDIGLAGSSAGLVITMAQIGYCTGVLLLVPLGDMLENRRLVAALVFGAAIALCAASQCRGALSLLTAMFLVGLFASAVQIIIPFGVGMAAEKERGRVIGLICAGGVLGMVLSRPASSFFTGLWGWRSVLLVSAGVLVLLGLSLYRALPAKKPASVGMSYPAALKSMGNMFLEMGELRARVLFMGLSFSCFTLFWSSVPIVLQKELAFNHTDVAIFSLASILSPVFAVMSGRLVDQGLGPVTTGIAVVVVACSFLITPLFGHMAPLFILSVFLLDATVHMISIITQQSVLILRPEARSRLNAVCIAVTFCGGAAGSSLGPWLYAHYGWDVTALTGFSLISCAAAVYLLFVRKSVGKSEPQAVQPA